MRGFLQGRDMEEQVQILAQHGPDEAVVLPSAGLAWRYSEVLIFETTWTKTSTDLYAFEDMSLYNTVNSEIQQFPQTRKPHLSIA